MTFPQLEHHLLTFPGSAGCFRQSAIGTNAANSRGRPRPCQAGRFVPASRSMQKATLRVQPPVTSPREPPFLTAFRGCGSGFSRCCWSLAEAKSRPPEVTGLTASAPSHLSPKAGEPLVPGTQWEPEQRPSQTRVGRTLCRRLLRARAPRGGTYLFAWQTP